MAAFIVIIASCVASPAKTSEPSHSGARQAARAPGASRAVALSGKPRSAKTARLASRSNERRALVVRAADAEDAPASDPRLFQLCDAAAGGRGIQAEEIFSFTQDDLDDDDVPSVFDSSSPTTIKLPLKRSISFSDISFVKPSKNVFGSFLICSTILR